MAIAFLYLRSRNLLWLLHMRNHLYIETVENVLYMCAKNRVFMAVLFIIASNCNEPKNLAMVDEKYKP